MGHYFNFALATGIAVVLALPGSAQPLLKARVVQAADADKILAEAEETEKAGQYENALELYLKAYTAGRTDPEIRERIRTCFRNVSQLERHRDPSFRQFVLSLTPYDAVSVFTEAIETINKLYPDRDRATIEKLFAAGLDELDRALIDPAFRHAFLPDVSDAIITKFRQTLRDGWRTQLPKTVREATHTAREVVSAATRQMSLKNGSVVAFELLCGASGGLDEYTMYKIPHSAGSVTSPIQELLAYGILIRLDTKGIVVVGLIPGSWAAMHTKLRTGDLVVRFNGKSMADVTTKTLFDAIRAAGPSAHQLEVVTPDDETAAAATVRLQNPLPTVYGIELLNAKNGVGYLRLANFQDQTPREIDEAVLELKARGAKVLVIDLRGNPGGLFAAAVDAVRLFLPSGLVVSTQGQAPEVENRIFTSDSGMAAYDLPVVLLIDTKTMSSAEIFAASLKENQRATLVGMSTFGKGLVQTPVPLQALNHLDNGNQPLANKTGLLVLTVAAVYSPSGAALNGVGVSPNLVEANWERQLPVAVQKAIDLLNSPPMPKMMR
jgi:carboxyl-terminal processing protease